MDRQHVISVLYFLEETLGFRLTLHWLRRYLEQEQTQDLENLIVTVANEDVFDYEAWSSITDGHSLKMPVGQALDVIKKGQKPTALDLIDRIDCFEEVIEKYFESQIPAIRRLIQAINITPSINWKDALSRNQVKSKIWLLETMHQQGWLSPESKILLVGGWVGILPFLIDLKGYQALEIVNLDLDVTVHPAARVLNRDSGFSFRSFKADVRSINLLDYQDYILVDTIVEHFADHSAWLKTFPPGTRMILQGNDMFDLEDHVNCHQDIFEFVDDCDLPVIHYQGYRSLQNCDRFMILGETR